MTTGTWTWKSPNLGGKEIEILRYGHVGPPMIVFPTHTATAQQFDDYGMPADCAHLLAAHRIQFFSISGFNKESWCNNAIHPRERVRAHLGYERFVMDEVIPLVRDVAKNDRIGCMGFSFGAYHALNMGLKYPEVFKVAMAFMGVYDLRGEVDGYYDDDFYLCNPPDYVANLTDRRFLDQYGKTTTLVLVGGEADPFHDSTVRMHEIMQRRGVAHWYEVWPAPAGHHEHWWKQQLPYLLEKLY